MLTSSAGRKLDLRRHHKTGHYHEHPITMQMLEKKIQGWLALGLEVGDVSLRWEKQTNHYSLYIIIYNIYIYMCVICMLYNLHCSQIHISLLTAACCCYPATRPTPASKWERSCNSNDLPIVPSAVLGLQGHCV